MIYVSYLVGVSPKQCFYRIFQRWGRPPLFFSEAPNWPKGVLENAFFPRKKHLWQYVGPTMICGKSDESANPSQIGSSPSCQWAFQVTCADHATNRTQGIYEEKKLPPWMVGLCWFGGR